MSIRNAGLESDIVHSQLYSEIFHSNVIVMASFFLGQKGRRQVANVIISWKLL